MKPLKLTIQGFGSYGEKAVIDFTNSKGIFLITGKTGSGKTTIFDAMVYALYGKTSGSNRSSKEMISSFCSEKQDAFVELEFILKDEKYTISRTMHQVVSKINPRIDNTVCLIYPDGRINTRTGKSKTTNEDSATAEIEKLIGLNADEFCQICILPQGEFVRILTAGTENREKILNTVFNTRVYQNFEEKITTLKKQYETTCEKSKSAMEVFLNSFRFTENQQLIDKINLFCSNNEFYFDSSIIDDFHIINDVDNSDLQQNENILTAIMTQYNTKIYEISNAIDKNNSVEKLAKCKENLNRLTEKEDTITKLKEEIVFIKNAKNIENDIIKLKDIRSSLEQNKQELSTLKLSFANIEIAFSKAQSALLTATENSKLTNELNIKINDLKNQIKAVQTLENAQLENKRITDALNLAKIELNSHKSAQIALQKKKIALENSFTDAAFYGDMLLKISQEKSDVTLQINALTTLNANINSALVKSTELSGISQVISDEKQEISSEKSLLNKLNKLVISHQSVILARSLNDGEKCPVCGSTSHPALACDDVEIPSEQEISQLENQLEQLQTKLSETEKKCAALKSEQDILIEKINCEIDNFSIQNAAKYQSSTLSDLQLLSNKLNKINTQIEKIISDKSTAEQTEKQIANIENDLAEINIKIINSSTLVQKLEIENAGSLAKIEHISSMFTDDILSKSVLQSNKEEIENRVISINNTLKKAQQEHSLQKENYDRQKAVIKRIEESLPKLETEFSAQNSAVNQLLCNHNFSNLESYQKYIDMSDLLDEKERIVNSYNTDLTLENSRKKELEKVINKYQPVRVDVLELEKMELEKTIKQIQEQISSKKANISNNQKVLQSIIQHNEIFTKQLDDYFQLREMNLWLTGIKSKKTSFVRFVQSLYLDKVIQLANRRLATMTQKRFVLLRDTGANTSGLTLNIYDAENRAERGVSTLSGGEMFKVALAMSLGMSDVIQMNNGGVKINTLLIDEGFGHLDDESINQALCTLNELMNDNVLVGIISHVEALKTQIEQQIEVKLTHSGSVVDTSKFNATSHKDCVYTAQ